MADKVAEEDKTEEKLGRLPRLEKHPGAEYIFEFVNMGKVIVDDKLVDTGRMLCEVLNEIYPQYKIYPSYLSLLKKRIHRGEDGYMLKDGQVFYADGRPLAFLGVKTSLEAIVQIGLENAISNPDKVEIRDVTKALELLKKYKDSSEGDESVDVWTQYLKTGESPVKPPTSRTRKRDVKPVPEQEQSPAPPPPELLALIDQDDIDDDVMPEGVEFEDTEVAEEE